jgi:hypothetical protein
MDRTEELSPKEELVLRMIRCADDLVELTVKFQRGEIDFIEATRRLPVDNSSALSHHAFADLIVKKRDGVVVQQTLRQLVKP